MLIDFRTRKLLDAEDEETLAVFGLRLPPSWMDYLRKHFPGQTDSELLRRIVATTVFELNAGGEVLFRRSPLFVGRRSH